MPDRFDGLAFLFFLDYCCYFGRKLSKDVEGILLEVNYLIHGSVNEDHLPKVDITKPVLQAEIILER